MKHKQCLIFYCQFNQNPDGGGAASCGYHALLRGMQLVQAKSNEKSDEYLQNILNDPGIIQHYFGKKGIFFGKNGTWRQDIIQKRKNDIYNGDWLDKEEIQYLWNENKNKFIFEEELCDLNVVDDVSLIGQVEVDLTSPFILEKVQPNLNKNKLFFVIFALGTMRQAREGEAYTLSYGHWYPLVMYQDQTGKRYYYIMDSASYDKVNRLKDENAWKIINLIEEAARSI